MANVLSELFSDIAGAIRDLAGESSSVKRKPTEFAEKIREVAENGGGSGGGGTLPAGLYWETMDMVAPNEYYQHWFQYNGDIYATALAYTGTGSDYAIHKYTDSGWTTVVPSTKVGVWLNAEFRIEFDGKIHYVGCSGKKHYAFDGASLTALSDIPVKVDYSKPFILDGQLVVQDYNSCNFYAWSKDTDTWSQINTKTWTYSWVYGFNVGTDAYFIDSTKLYKIQDGSPVQIGTLDAPPTKYHIAHDGKLYYNGGGSKNHPSPLYVYDFSTNTSRRLGRVPKYAKYSNFWSYNGQVCFTFGDNNLGYSSAIMHVV